MFCYFVLGSKDSTKHFSNVFMRIPKNKETSTINFFHSAKDCTLFWVISSDSRCIKAVTVEKRRKTKVENYT